MHDRVAPARRQPQEVRSLAPGGHLRRGPAEEALADVPEAAADGAEAVGAGDVGDGQGLGHGGVEGLGGCQHADALVVHDEATRVCIGVGKEGGGRLVGGGRGCQQGRVRMPVSPSRGTSVCAF